MKRCWPGTMGRPPRMAMTIITRMAEVQGAERLLDITAAHCDSTIYMGPATLEFAERLAGLGARVVVPTTLNVGGLDEAGWQAWPVPADYASLAHRQMLAYQEHGLRPHLDLRALSD